MADSGSAPISTTEKLQWILFGMVLTFLLFDLDLPGIAYGFRF